MVKLLNPKPAHKPKCYPVYKDITDPGRWEMSMYTLIKKFCYVFAPVFPKKPLLGDS